MRNEVIQLTTTKQFYVECVSLEKRGEMCHSNIKPHLLWHFTRGVKSSTWDEQLGASTVGGSFCTLLSQGRRRARAVLSLLLDSGYRVEEEPVCAEQGWVVRKGVEEREKFVCFSTEEKTNVCKEKEWESVCSNTANRHQKFSSYPLHPTIWVLPLSVYLNASKTQKQSFHFFWPHGV